MSQILEMAVPGSLRVQATLKYGRGPWQVWSCVSAKGVVDFVSIMGVHNAEKNIGRSLVIMRYRQGDEMFEWPQAFGGHIKYWLDLDFHSVHSLHFVNWLKKPWYFFQF